MNENLNLVEILKDCPKGMKLYSPIFGDVSFLEIKDTGRALLVIVLTCCNTRYEFYTDGRFNKYYEDSECMLFPSKDNRDWSKFVAPDKKPPVKKIERFDPNTLKTFDQILVRDDHDDKWFPNFFSHYEGGQTYPYVDISGAGFKYVIPYLGNEDLALKCKMPKKYYRYWED